MGARRGFNPYLCCPKLEKAAQFFSELMFSIFINELLKCFLQRWLYFVVRTNNLK